MRGEERFQVSLAHECLPLAYKITRICLAPMYDIGTRQRIEKATTSRKSNTFINFGGVYPHQTFTGWIPAGTSLASDPSSQSLQGKKINITRRIEVYRGKPEMRVL